MADAIRGDGIGEGLRDVFLPDQLAEPLRPVRRATTTYDGEGSG